MNVYKFIGGILEGSPAPDEMIVWHMTGEKRASVSSGYFVALNEKVTHIKAYASMPVGALIEAVQKWVDDNQEDLTSGYRYAFVWKSCGDLHLGVVHYYDYIGTAWQAARNWQTYAMLAVELGEIMYLKEHRKFRSNKPSGDVYVLGLSGDDVSSDSEVFATMELAAEKAIGYMNDDVAMSIEEAADYKRALMEGKSLTWDHIDYGIARVTIQG